MQLLREPLLHFAVVGAILFGGYSWFSKPPEGTAAGGPVRIGEGDVRWLTQTWSSQWLRKPSAEELKGLVDDLLNEKLMAREAEAVGLGEDDTIIRRRLAQKLKFLVEDTVQLAEASETELRQFYATNLKHFETPAKLSFQQVYFNPEGRTDAATDAEVALAELTAQGQTHPAAGDRLLFGDDFDYTDELVLSAMFGIDFARRLFALQPGAWRGPVKSGYGFHLVFVSRRTPKAPKPFETVREQVLAEWRAARQTQVNRDYHVELRNKYGVELEDGVKAVLGAEPAPSVAAR